MNEAVQKDLQANKSKASWPEPRELSELSQIEHQSHELLGKVLKTRIELSAADEAGKPANLPKMWAVPSGEQLRLDGENVQDGNDPAPLAPGKYDVYLDESEGGAGPLPAAVRVARGVEVEQGKPAKVPLRSGIRLKLADKLPTPSRWFVVPADAACATVVAQRSGGAVEPIWLPPGNYDVYCLQASDQRDRPVCVARNVKVEGDAIGDVAVRGCVVKLQAASWVPPRDPGSGWWGLVQAGDQRRNAVEWSRSETELVMPSGIYDLVWVQDGEHQRPMTLARGIKLSPDRPLTISVEAGMRLKPAKNLPPLDPKEGWWGAVPAFGKSDEPCNWSIGRSDQPLLLAPGVYDVVWKQDDKHPARRLASGVTVAASKDGPTEVEIPSVPK